MFFFAFLGAPTGEPRWRELLSRHAEWLGLRPYAFSRTVADGRVFAFGWVSLRPPDTHALVREQGSGLTIIPLDTLTRAQALAQESPRGFETNAIRMDVSLLSGEVRVAVPILTVEQFYHANSGDDWVFGNDLRLMVRWAGLRLSPLGVYLMFQCDYVPPPRTLSETIRRVQPGHVFALSAGGVPSEKKFFRPSDMLIPADDGDPAERVRQALDSVLKRMPRPAAVHFSGGVDSGLIAARLAALGRTDVGLQNFTTGPESDPFYYLAQDMADHLGLACDRVGWNPDRVPEMMADMAREYGFPFSDPAILPTLALVRGREQHGEIPAMVATGTSAGHPFDTGFRLSPWRKIYAIPSPLRALGAVAYPLWFWQREGTAARIASTLQRSVQFTVFENAAFLHSTLLGLAYDIPPDIRAAMRDALDVVQVRLPDGMAPEDRVAMMAMLRHGTHMCGARPFDPLRRRGALPLHVFMEPEVIRTAFSISWREKRGDGTAKFLLKALLAQSVPREWVYRERQAFLLPFRDVFTHPVVRQMVGDTVLSSGNPLLAFCRPGGVRRVFGRALAGQPLHVGAQRFVWALTKLTLWLEQMRRAMP